MLKFLVVTAHVLFQHMFKIFLMFFYYFFKQNGAFAGGTQSTSPEFVKVSCVLPFFIHDKSSLLVYDRSTLLSTF